MTAMRVRKIVRIDQSKCNGCGLCVPQCAEGAIRIENGKARLVAENLCDGLGACLGHCPQDAITIEERPADEFDAAAVERAAAAAISLPRASQAATRQPAGSPAGTRPSPAPAHGHACPGSMLRRLNRPAAEAADSRSAQDRPSCLGQWPVQLALVPPAGPIWQDADVLICADCVPFAMNGFHEKLLAAPAGGSRTVAVACPKLDDIQAHVQKLTAIFAGNPIRSITVAHMEVPCCGGIVRAVHAALAASGRDDIAVHDITVNIDGTCR